MQALYDMTGIHDTAQIMGPPTFADAPSPITAAGPPVVTALEPRDSAGLGARRRNSLYRLYRSPKLWADIWLLREERRSPMALKGQLRNHLDRLQPLAGVAVFMMAGKRFVAGTFSDPQGNFEVRYEERHGLTLFMALESERFVSVPLKAFE